MTDALGWRAKFGVLAPSTNTIVEPDFYRLSVPGVTAHFARMHIRDQHLGSDAAFEALLEQVREEMGHAVARVLTAEAGLPDHGHEFRNVLGWGGGQSPLHHTDQSTQPWPRRGDGGRSLRTGVAGVRCATSRHCHALP